MYEIDYIFNIFKVGRKPPKSDWYDHPYSDYKYKGNVISSECLSTILIGDWIN